MTDPSDENGPADITKPQVSENVIPFPKGDDSRAKRTRFPNIYDHRAKRSPPAPESAVDLNCPEMWPEPVETGQVLDALVGAIRRHVALPDPEIAAIALWIAHTWVYDRFKFQHTLRLAICSPVRRCGKTTLLAILAALCRRPLKADNFTSAAVFHAIDHLKPVTILIDEADSFLPRSESLRGVLNSGFERTGAVVRVVSHGGKRETRLFATFSAVAVAAIGSLPSTLADRSVPIVMRRKIATETTQKLSAGRNRAALADIASMLARWASDTWLPRDPPIPKAFNDREGDLSIPLLAVADAAGADWGARARTALAQLFARQSTKEGGQEPGIQLLAAIEKIFAGTAQDRLPSDTIVAELDALEGRPWSTVASKKFSKHQLANQLRPFGITPEQWHDSSKNRPRRGYLRAHFEDAWARYLAQNDR